jgi:hypothetical protein
MNQHQPISAANVADLAKLTISSTLAVSIFMAKQAVRLATPPPKAAAKETAESFNKMTSAVKGLLSSSAASLVSPASDRAATATPAATAEAEPEDSAGAPAPGGAGPGQLRPNVYKVGEAAQSDFAPSPLLFGLFQAGDQAQRALVDLAVDTATLKVFRPNYLPRLAVDITRRSTNAVKLVANTEDRQVVVRRLQNTFNVINIVNRHESSKRALTAADYPLDEMIAKCYEEGKYPALWAVEGLGEKYAQIFLDTGAPVRGLLTTGKGAKAPEHTQLMMHAGAGLAFAKHAIGDLTPYSSDAEFERALKVFLDLVRDNSLEGYTGAALESLGLVMRTWNTQLVRPISSRLKALDPIAAEYFWHGAGRAMYFSPMNLLPGFSPWDSAAAETPDETARKNAVAGVTWAFTVVNLLQPTIMANILGRRGTAAPDDDAFANGVLSTLTMASEMVPDNINVAAFCQYRPNRSDPAQVDAWDRIIGADLQERVDRCRKILREHRRLDEVFRQQSLSGLVESLDRGAAAAVAK